MNMSLSNFPANPISSDLLKLELPKGTPELLDLEHADRWLFDLSAAGVVVSGDSGSGKSVLMRQAIGAAIENGTGVVAIDPHGDLVNAIHRDCLAYGPSVRDRVYYFAPGQDKLPIGPLNPLSVEPFPGETPYGFRARLDCRAVHTAHLTINCSGETDFDQKPQLYRWLTNIFLSSALMGLSMADGLKFLDFDSEMFGPLVDAIPDELLQSEFRLLASMSPAEREVYCASTRARLNNIFSSIVLRCHLGVPRNAINVRKLMEERAIVLVNLAHLGRLDENYHIPVLANLWVAEILHTVFSTPEHQRVPFLLALDELPVFRASSHLLTSALRQVRKMQLRFLLAFQGIHSFPLGKDDPLLRATSMCGSSFYFRHTDEDDAMYFGGKISLPEYDPLRPKFIHCEEEQYQDGYDFEPLVDQSWQRAYSTSESTGTSDSDNWQQNWIDTTGFGRSQGTNSTDTKNWSTEKSISHSESHGRRIQQAIGNTFGTGGGSSQSQTISGGTNETISHTKNASTSEGEAEAHSRQRSSGTQEATSQQSTSGNSTNRTTNRDRQMQLQNTADGRGQSDVHGTASSRAEHQSASVGDTRTKSTQRSEGTADSVAMGRQEGFANQIGSIKSWDAKETKTDTTGTDHSQANATSFGQGAGGAHAVGRSSSRDWQESHGRGGAEGGGRTQSQERGTSETEGYSVTQKQTPLARMKWRKVLRFVEFLTRDEQTMLRAQQLSTMPTGQAIHQIAGHSVKWVQVELPDEPWADAPVTLQKALRGYFERIRSLEVYHEPTKILERRKQFRQQLHDILLDTVPTLHLPAIADLLSPQVADDSPFSI